MNTHSSYRRFAAVLVALALAAALLPASAVAANPAPTDVWQAVGISIQDLAAGKTPTLVITCYAKDGLTPPVDAAMAIPKGSEVGWAGELLGGDPSADPTLEVRVEKGEAYDLVYFTLQQSPRAQLELTVPADMLQRTEKQALIDLAWTSAGALDRARMAVAVPPDAHMEDTTPVLEVTPEIGRGVLYSVETTPVAAGQTLRITGKILTGVAPEMQEAVDEANAAEETPTASADATGEPGAADGDTPETPTEDGPGVSTTWLLVGALAIALVAVAALLVQRIRSSSAGGGHEAGSPADDPAHGEDS